MDFNRALAPRQQLQQWWEGQTPQSLWDTSPPGLPPNQDGLPPVTEDWLLFMVSSPWPVGPPTVS